MSFGGQTARRAIVVLSILGISAPWASAQTNPTPSLPNPAQPVSSAPATTAPATNGPAATAPATLPAAPAFPADPILDQIEEAIRVNGQRFLTANYHSPWQIFHGMVAYRRSFQLKVGEQKMPAIDWISTADPRFDQRQWILITPHGAKFHPYTRPYAFEGHQSQSLALLSESSLPPDFKFKASGREVTIEQMLRNTMMEVTAKEETTWVLWALINYFPTETAWVNQHGEPWSIERLVQNEVNAQTPTRPCGGNHNLFALSRARDKYLAEGKTLKGVWMQADQKIKQYAQIARSMQNTDGSFSSNFFKGPGVSNDMNTRFNTTGHTMEFLSLGLSESQLSEPWVRNAVAMLSRELIQHRKAAVDCGPLYHSLNGLIIYRNRLRPQDPSVASDIPYAPVPISTRQIAAIPAPAIAVPATTPAAPMPQTAPGVTSIAKPSLPTVTTDIKPAPGAPMPLVVTTAKPAMDPAPKPEAPVTPKAAPTESDADSGDPTAPQLPVNALTPDKGVTPSSATKPSNVTYGPVDALRPANR